MTTIAYWVAYVFAELDNQIIILTANFTLFFDNIRQIYYYVIKVEILVPYISKCKKDKMEDR